MTQKTFQIHVSSFKHEGSPCEDGTSAFGIPVIVLPRGQSQISSKIVCRCSLLLSEDDNEAETSAVFSEFSLSVLDLSVPLEHSLPIWEITGKSTNGGKELHGSELVSPSLFAVRLLT